VTPQCGGLPGSSQKKIKELEKGEKTECKHVRLGEGVVEGRGGIGSQETQRSREKLKQLGTVGWKGQIEGGGEKLVSLQRN